MAAHPVDAIDSHHAQGGRRREREDLVECANCGPVSFAGPQQVPGEHSEAQPEQEQEAGARPRHPAKDLSSQLLLPHDWLRLLVNTIAPRAINVNSRPKDKGRISANVAARAPIKWTANKIVLIRNSHRGGKFREIFQNCYANRQKYFCFASETRSRRRGVAAW